MAYRSFTVLSAAALLIAAAHSATAGDRGDARRTRGDVTTESQQRSPSARTRDAYDAWRPAVPAAALDEAARYRGTVPQIAGH
ncbi:hypothetical protein JQ557_18850 [Bradyrhizobium sp. U87765 SZCCT0131]|uniref:hypothetical protein n=1 Tax=unclassified Bradyrhizobium TaxID=2631580 RepID=UPI001BADF0FE|nr:MULTISPECIES: hypothetical protein [unclassified Bradyrhizobium]MBR1220071.1 hypothetical protein [Bradyrhizobium sp. U87765 SZCCT0131]MBR1263473.1 hypothetical protein [Bradyrhizobium sp. U87765 SZCCT0134]MBR1309042.1 hypothetical protein [Bradyrhizobium sp. U87765 SZCCT0110]MBR1323805.1 hypothetical protein [Bradyrhizobium sp. U87765 SZCCT0109]MBR1349357.1 hypothetical protein [Bradyrhizobium sp. U87765 SZCCT0048]